MHAFSQKPLKTVQLSSEIFPRYKAIDRKTLLLFPELFPFGGKINENNRWLWISELIPWDDLEEEDAKEYSDMGCPAKDEQLVIGLMLLKHMTGLSYEGVATTVMEYRYMQASVRNIRDLRASRLEYADQDAGEVRSGFFQAVGNKNM